MNPSVFLDWFGVIADPVLMSNHWRKIEAQTLQGKFGGESEKWLEVHDRAFKWYLKFWARYGPNSKADYRKLWRHSEMEWMRRTLLWGEVEPPRSGGALFKLDRWLTYQVTSQIDAVYSDARSALGELKRLGCRNFLVSNIDNTYAKGVLKASRLNGFFEDAYSPHSLNAFKGSKGYWKKVLRMSKSVPPLSVVVDDRTMFLETPARLGLKTVLVGPSVRQNSGFLTIKTISMLPKVLLSLFPELSRPR